MHAAAVGSTRGAAAAFTAMMETHKDFEEALDLVFDGPADVLVGTRPDLRSREPQRESPSQANGITVQNVGASTRAQLWAFAPVS
ncbi:hypothetical protein, conserved [Eimeria tenella]|uniref:Uncharacterized protein n=1 Tax=Eimeria tenella TaxID=5802 RepID=U6KJD8_EIMTE|nr:hypothetical protein, conserved [Eimeria tenella]CDJ38049.1 hypothetical protein, conserved [Eimeria tenella]|eukprot:XP_013228887.1 hypothetical protein, conserved [Eimeria tenella]